MSHSVRSVMQRAGSFVFPRIAYARRVGLPCPSPVPAGSMALLRRMMLAHSSAIPFENTDPILDRPISTELPDLCTKLIAACRGGYCMEHNTLMLAALHDAGFARIDFLLASVLWGSETPQYTRTHAFLLVHMQDEASEANKDAHTDTNSATRWLVDVGFGQCATQAPLRLDTTAPQLTPGGVFRVVPRSSLPGGSQRSTNSSSDAMYTQQVAVLPPDAARTMSPAELLREAATPRTRWKSIYCFDLHPHTAAEVEEQNVYVYTNTFCACSFAGCRAYGDWHDEGTLYTPRVICTMKDNVRKVRPGLPYTFRVDTGEVVRGHNSNKDGSRAKEPEVYVAESPEMLYDCIIEGLGSRLAQTQCPAFTVTREDFVRHAREKMVVFGGHGKSPHELATQSLRSSL